MWRRCRKREANRRCCWGVQTASVNRVLLFDAWSCCGPGKALLKFAEEYIASLNKTKPEMSRNNAIITSQPSGVGAARDQPQEVATAPAGSKHLERRRLKSVFFAFFGL